MSRGRNSLIRGFRLGFECRNDRRPYAGNRLRRLPRRRGRRGKFGNFSARSGIFHPELASAEIRKPREASRGFPYSMESLRIGKPRENGIVRPERIHTPMLPTKQELRDFYVPVKACRKNVAAHLFFRLALLALAMYIANETGKIVTLISK